MLRLALYGKPREAKRARLVLLALTAAMVFAGPVFGLITGGEGNRPLSTAGLPEGALAIFNNPARVAWWEGPPFGGGQWHAEYRGDIETLKDILADFGELDVKQKRVVVHDGVGNSFWLNPNREPKKEADAKVDWVFMVWQTASWQKLRKMPADLRPGGGTESDESPPSEIHVYTGGNIRWADVSVPKGIVVIDERLEAHGFTPADGHVLEGKVIDLATKRPIAAKVRLERIEPQPKGGYHYTRAAEVSADAQGKWVLKRTPAGWYRVIVEADGYVPRVAGHTRTMGEPCWQSYACGLARPGPVSGRVTDETGKALADVEVRLGDVISTDDARYESPQGYTTRSGGDGRFRLEQVPVGKGTVRAHKSGYCRPGLGQPIATPAKDVALSMRKSASVRVTVDFTETERPAAYIVELEPEGGSKVGAWSGSAHIDAKGQFLFEDVPPGRYVLKGHPNPSSAKQQTEPVTVELGGGEAKEITLTAK